MDPLTFGDMTREVNIFNLGKQPRDVGDQTFEVNLIENITSEHREQLKLELRVNSNWSLWILILIILLSLL